MILSLLPYEGLRELNERLAGRSQQSFFELTLPVGA